jgi:hypothetical protein
MLALIAALHHFRNVREKFARTIANPAESPELRRRTIAAARSKVTSKLTPG